MPIVGQQVRIYLGIDPGASGGLAFLNPSARVVISTPMPKTERDTWDWFNGECIVRAKTVQVTCAVEKVWGHVGKDQPGSAMFKFGRNTGMLIGFLVAAEIQFEEVTPQRWQNGLEIPGRKKTENKTQWKNRLKSRAQQLFPTEKVTLATADALLIAEFCRRKTEGLL